MGTIIFETFEDFLNRGDKRVNGVSPEFAKNHPNYEADNQTNMYCWNCEGCNYCIDCEDCKYCEYCEHSLECIDCFKCHYCEKLENKNNKILNK